MADELAGGPTGPPRLRSRVVLGVVAAVLFGYAVTHRYSAPVPEAAPPSPSIRVPVPTRPAVPQLTGRLGAGPAGLRLLVDGFEPRIVDAHTLAVTPVPGLRLRPGSTAQVLQLGPSTLAALSPLYGPDGGVYLIRPGSPPRLLGSEGFAIPSRDGAIVLATYRPGGTSVTGLTLDRQVRWQWLMPGNVLLLRDTPAGLLLAQYPDAVAGEADLLLVDVRTGKVRRRLGHGRYPVASSDRAVAWAPTHCAAGCSVVVADLASGDTRSYPVYRRPVLAAGAFAPDGRRLALTFSGVAADEDGQLESGTVGILDLRTGRKAFVPGLSTPPAEHADVTWSPDGRWLVLGVKYPGRERIALWRPGQQVTILPTELPGEPSTATLTVLG